MSEIDIKNRLFELIREEKVIVFSGAGTSIEADFPNGEKLRDILYNSLTQKEKLTIDKSLSLDRFSEEFCMIKNDNRKSLNNILLNQFLFKTPKKTNFHDLLSSISQIRTIITTNYDKLYEKAYGNKCQVIFKSNHLSNKNQNIQTHIYKIHGDISDLKSIIITSKDYENYFKNHETESIIWSDVKAKMASNHILFIGYSLADPNISIIFDRIYEELNQPEKEHFFISPSIQDYKISHLKKKNINYIKMKSTDFAIELKKNINSNIVDDFQKNKLSYDTFINYSENHGGFPLLGGNSNNKIVNDFKDIDKPIKRTLELQITGDFKKEIFDFTTSKSIDSLEVSGERILSSTLFYGDILLRKDKLESIKIIPIPKNEMIVDVRFKNGFEYFDIPTKFYAKKDYQEIQATLKNSTINFKFSRENKKLELKLEHSHNQFCGNLKSEIEEMILLKNISEGNTFKVYNKQDKKNQEYAIESPEMLNSSEFYLEYFKNLKIIENHFDISFDKIEFEEIDNKKLEQLNLIVSNIENKIAITNWNGEIRVDLNKIDKNHENMREKILDKNFKCIYPSNSEYIINLYDHKINLGYSLTELIDSYIVNFKEIKNKTQDIVIFKSKKKKIKIFWSKEKLI